MKGATNPYVPPPVSLNLRGSFRLLGMEHLHQEPMVMQGFMGPASHCRTHVKALPASMRVLHQTGVEKSGKRLCGRGQGWPEHLVNVNSVETTCTSVTENLVPENAQLRCRDQLLGRNGGKVEEKLLRCFSFQAGECLESLWKGRRKSALGSCQQIGLQQKNTVGF